MKKLLIAIVLVVSLAAHAQESYVQLPPNSTGTKLRMRCNTIGADLVCSQGFFIDDGSGSGALGLLASPLYVNFAAGATHAITAASLPLPTGAATDATLTGGTQKAIARGGAKGATAAADVTTTANGADHQALDVFLNNASVAVTGTFWQATQPISGTVTANAGTNLNTSALALESGGNLATIVTNTNKIPSSPATDRTTAASPFSIRLSDGAAFYDARSIRALTSADVVTVQALSTALPAGTNNIGDVDVLTLPAIPAGSNNIGDVDVLTLPAIPAGNNNIGDVDIASAPSVAANNAAAPGSVDVIGVEAVANGTQPTAATSGNVRRQIGALDGAQYARPYGPVTWSCGLNAIAASLTQCQAAPGAGLKLYLTDITVQTTTTTSGTYALQTGTGSNCGTGTAALFPVSGTGNRFNAPITTQSASNFSFTTPLVAPANSAICLIGVATNTISIQLQGYTAP